MLRASHFGTAISLLTLIGCAGASGSDGPDLGTGGKPSSSSGGMVSAQGGVGQSQGGASATANGGNTTSSSGGAGSGGGAQANGGAPSANGGSPSTNGGSSGGAPSTNGGAASKGGAASSGGSGGASKGGGTSAGGTSNANGGSTSKGGATSTGGSTTCDWSEPPANVAAWVQESWDSQLSNNVKTRKDWNLDNVMADAGQMNLCVRWGATSAVPESVKMNLSTTIARWFNDWFKGLGNYGCFPYGNGIKVNVTGWAVRPGKESLLGTIDSSIPIYTETDGDGEPKCPDACSSFVHWDHKFPNCKAGADKHSDYWLWFDDTLPGGGGAAAVGGDWGLRMPVSTFTGHFNDTSFMICEHEMGHGFGFQDYYDWTGSRPNGGSIMIVGSTSNQAPTTGDLWLLKRTWKEMKTLRGW